MYRLLPVAETIFMWCEKLCCNNSLWKITFVPGREAVNTMEAYQVCLFPENQLWFGNKNTVFDYLRTS